MTTMVFVNFPVREIRAATVFYEKLGFKKNSDFSDNLVSCMVWDENFYIMLLSYEHYQTFIGDKKIADTQSISGALIAFSLPNAESVKNLGRLASENGGKTFHLENGIPENIMYDLEIQDLDGNSLQPIWMATESDNH